jgi:hypothetical protein
MGIAARARATELSAAAVVPRYEDLYAGLLAAGSTTSSVRPAIASQEA